MDRVRENGSLIPRPRNSEEGTQGDQRNFHRPHLTARNVLGFSREKRGRIAPLASPTSQANYFLAFLVAFFALAAGFALDVFLEAAFLAMVSVFWLSFFRPINACVERSMMRTSKRYEDSLTKREADSYRNAKSSPNCLIR